MVKSVVVTNISIHLICSFFAFISRVNLVVSIHDKLNCYIINTVMYATFIFSRQNAVILNMSTFEDFAIFEFGKSLL